MKISKPKLAKLKVDFTIGTAPFGTGRAQKVGQVKSGHHHLASNAGGATPGFNPGPQKKSSKRMY